MERRSRTPISEAAAGRCLALLSTLLVASALTLGCSGPGARTTGGGGGSAPPTPLDRKSLASSALTGLEATNGRLVVRDVAPRNPAAARRALARADALSASGYVLESLTHYAEAILRDPGPAEPYAALARALTRTGEASLAAAAARSALDREPGLVEVRFLLAELTQAGGDLAGAVAELRRVLAEDPDHGPAHGRLAVYLHYAGEPLAALDHLQEAERLGSPPPPVLRHLLAHGSPPRARILPTGVASSSAGRAGRGTAQIGPPVRVDAGPGQSNETSAAAVGQLPFEVVAGWHDFSSGTVHVSGGVSLDGGATWTRQPVRPPAPFQTTVEGDPMTAADPRTGNAWIGGIAFNPSGGPPAHLFVARRPPGANGFTAPVIVAQSVHIDKALMAAGPAPGNPFSTRLYVAYRNLSPYGSRLQYSTNLGVSWSAPLSFDDGIGHLPRVGGSGDLYVVTWDGLSTQLGRRVELFRSTNGGVSVTGPTLVATRLDAWTASDHSRTPGTFRVPPFTYLAIDPADDTLYVVYADTTDVVSGDANLDLYFTRSTDQGATWTTPVVIHDDSWPPGDQFFPWLEVDSDGNLHLTYWDTANRLQGDDDGEGLIDVIYAVSTDGGSSWSPHRLTTEPFGSAPAGGGTQFLGDYAGLAAAGDRIDPVYPRADGGDTDIYSRAVDLKVPPSARDDHYATAEATALDIHFDDLLLNDEDTVAAEVCAHGQPQNGTLVPFAGGVTYQASPGSLGTDSISYSACGPGGQSAAKVEIEVYQSAAPTLADDFETGLDPAWQEVATGGAVITTSSRAALQGDGGLQASVAGGGTAYVETSVPGDRAYVGSFHLDPRAMSMAVGDRHAVLEGIQQSSSQVVFRLEIDRTVSAYRLRARVRDDSGVWSSSIWTGIQGPVAVRLFWTAEQGLFVPGGIGLEIDGAYAGHADASNGSLSLDSVRLGVVSGADAGTAGHHRIDSYRWRRPLLY